MAKLFYLSLLVLSFTAQADFFGLGSDDGYKSRLPALIEKIKGIPLSTNPGYEESFNQAVKQLENGIEEEKLFCSGEATDEQGRTLPKEQKQLCFRRLKNHYLEAMDVVFDVKKKYLGMIHSQHLEKLGEIQKKLKSDIEKNF